MPAACTTCSPGRAKRRGSVRSPPGRDLAIGLRRQDHEHAAAPRLRSGADRCWPRPRRFWASVSPIRRSAPQITSAVAVRHERAVVGPWVGGGVDDDHNPSTSPRNEPTTDGEPIRIVDDDEMSGIASITADRAPRPGQQPGDVVAERTRRRPTVVRCGIAIPSEVRITRCEQPRTGAPRS